MGTTSMSTADRSKSNLSGCHRREQPGNEGLPAAKRHRGCIKYYLQQAHGAEERVRDS